MGEQAPALPQKTLTERMDLSTDKQRTPEQLAAQLQRVSAAVSRRALKSEAAIEATNTRDDMIIIDGGTRIEPGDYGYHADQNHRANSHHEPNRETHTVTRRRRDMTEKGRRIESTVRVDENKGSGSTVATAQVKKAVGYPSREFPEVAFEKRNPSRPLTVTEVGVQPSQAQGAFGESELTQQQTLATGVNVARELRQNIAERERAYANQLDAEQLASAQAQQTQATAAAEAHNEFLSV